MRPRIRLRYLAILIGAGLLLMMALVLSGCAEDIISEAPDGEEVTSSCVGCHSDGEILYQTASEEEEVVSAETSGEG